MGRPFLNFKTVAIPVVAKVLVLLRFFSRSGSAISGGGGAIGGRRDRGRLFFFATDHRKNKAQTIQTKCNASHRETSCFQLGDGPAWEHRHGAPATVVYPRSLRDLAYSCNRLAKFGLGPPCQAHSLTRRQSPRNQLDFAGRSPRRWNKLRSFTNPTRRRQTFPRCRVVVSAACRRSRSWGCVRRQTTADQAGASPHAL
jgi:hypothetical protein